MAGRSIARVGVRACLFLLALAPGALARQSAPVESPWCVQQQGGDPDGPACKGTWDGPYDWGVTACLPTADPFDPCSTSCDPDPIAFGEIPHAMLVLRNPTAHLADPVANRASWGVLLFDTGDPDSTTQPWWMWNPATPGALETGVPEVAKVLFCSGHNTLADGRVFVAGGQRWPADHGIVGDCTVFGPKWAWIYDPEGTEPGGGGPGAWTRVTDMNAARYYPTNEQVSDSGGSPSDRVLVMTGGGGSDVTYEVYDPATDSWLVEHPFGTVPKCLMAYPRAHLTPSGNPSTSRGEVFVSSPYQYDVSEHAQCTIDQTATPYPTHRLRLPLAGFSPPDWIEGPAPQTSVDRADNNSVVLVQDSRPGQPDPIVDVFVGAGKRFVFPPLPGSGIPDTVWATFARVRNPHQGGAWEDLPSLERARFHANLVLLPGRKLFAVGGQNPVLPNGLFLPELLDLTTEGTSDFVWRLMAPHDKRREYHSWALLLPDGRVLVGGGRKHDTDQNYMHAEIFNPPHLYRERRAVVQSSPTVISYGSTFSLQLGDLPPSGIASIELIRPGSATHSVDFTQRLVDLHFEDQGGGWFLVSEPSAPEVAPPGWYMLFAVSDKGAPSVSRAVLVQ